MKNITKYLGLLFLTTITGCADYFDEQPNHYVEEQTGTRVAELDATDYYWFDNKKISLQKLDEKFFVMFDPAIEKTLENELSKSGMTLNNVEKVTADGYSQHGTVKIAATIEGNYEKVKTIFSHVYYSAPYYKTELGEGRLTNRFSIKLKKETDLTLLEVLAQKNRVEILGVNQYLDQWYELACTNFSKGNALEMGNLFYETGLFDAVDYDLGGRGALTSINEPLYADGTLWHLGNYWQSPTTQYNINYIGARELEFV